MCFCVARYLRHNSVGGHNVLHLLGPGVHEAEPSAPQRDKGAIFDLEFVTVGVDLLSHLQHYEQNGPHSKNMVSTETHTENTIHSSTVSLVDSFSYFVAFSTGTLSVALCQVADVVLVEILIEGGSQQLLGQVG